MLMCCFDFSATSFILNTRFSQRTSKNVGVCAVVTIVRDKLQWKKSSHYQDDDLPQKRKKYYHIFHYKGRNKKGKTRGVCEETDKTNGSKIGETQANCNTVSPSLLARNTSANIWQMSSNVFKWETTKLSSEALASSKVTTQLFYLL